MENQFCPLLLAQHLSGGDLPKCRKEECAWYVRTEKDFGRSACAIQKLGAATLIKSGTSVSGQK